MNLYLHWSGEQKCMYSHLSYLIVLVIIKFHFRKSKHKQTTIEPHRNFESVVVTKKTIKLEFL